MEEIVIWDCLIEWGIQHTPGLESEGSDEDKWTDEDSTLRNPISLIRF